MKFFKYLGYVLFLFFFAQVASAAVFDSGLQSFYNFNNNNFSDATGNYSAATNTGTSNSIGIINDSREYDGSADRIDYDTLDLNNSWSVTMWINATGFVGGDTYLQTNNTGNYMLIGRQVISTNKVEVMMFTGGAAYFATEPGATPLNLWTHYVFTCDGSTLKIFRNAAEQASASTPSCDIDIANYRTGLDVGGGNAYQGNIDALGFFSRNLTQTDINELYNSGTGLEFTGVTPPTTPVLAIDNISLVNGTFTNQNSLDVDLNISATNTNTNINTTLYLSNGSSYQIGTNTQNVTFTLNNIQEGVYNIWTFSENNETNVTSSNFTYTFDFTNPSLSVAAFTEFNSYTINFSSIINVSDNNLDTCTVSIDNNDTINCTNQSYVFTTNGNHTFNVTATDLANNSNTSNNNILFINPYQTWTFKDNITNATLTDYTFGGFASNGSIVQIKTYDLGLGNQTLTFIKSGYLQTNFSFNINTSSDINDTLFVQPVTLTIKIYNSTNPSEQLTFNVTILNGTSTQVFNNEFNFSKNFGEIPTGNIELRVTAPGFAEAKFFNTITEFTSITITGYLVPLADFSIITFKTLEFGSSDPIANVTIEAQQLINGSTVTIAQARTDGTGQTFMNLDALIEYTFIFSKDGFVTSTINAIPGTTSYTIRLRFSVEEFNFADGVGYQFTPTAPILYIPDNFTFQGIVSGTSLTTLSYTLTDQNGTVIFTDTSTNPTGATFSTVQEILNDTNITTLTATISYIRNGITTTVNKEYSIVQLVNTSFIGVATNYGQDTSEEAQLTRWLYMIITIAGALLAGRLLNLNATGSGLFLIPVAGVFYIIGWMPLSYFAVISAASLFFFIGGSLITR